jgi:tetratricopeptide (TPR) repeat protein
VLGASSGAEAPPGTRVGPYRIEKKLGEGGMGVVYEAVQEEPVRRRVALKLVKLGLDSREVVRRFEVERQALARMEHGSIAELFDAGAAPDGRPYFAMELVAGPPITEYCDRERLSVARRAALLVEVARAVHHAHQRGVLHRDLKASNVLVATEQGRAVPKVIDFGVARAGDDHPRVAMAMNNLALTVHVVGDYEAARRLFEELLPLRRRLLGEEHPDYQITLFNFGKLLHDLRDLEAAARVTEEALALQERSFGAKHPQVASTLAESASVAAKLGRTDEALARARRALAIRHEAFGPGHTTIASSLGYLAEVHALRGERAEADRLHAESVALLRETDGREPRTAEALLGHGRFALEAGELARAEALLGEALAIFRERLPENDRRIARAESALGACLGRVGRYDQGEALLAAALAKLASPETPDTEDARAGLAALRAARARLGGSAARGRRVSRRRAPPRA